MEVLLSGTEPAGVASRATTVEIYFNRDFKWIVTSGSVCYHVVNTICRTFKYDVNCCYLKDARGPVSSFMVLGLCEGKIRVCYTKGKGKLLSSATGNSSNALKYFQRT